MKKIYKKILTLGTVAIGLAPAVTTAACGSSSVSPALAKAREEANKIIDELNIKQDGWHAGDGDIAWTSFQDAITKAKSDVNKAKKVDEVKSLVKSKTEGTLIASVLREKAEYTKLNKYQGTMDDELKIKFGEIKTSVGNDIFQNATKITGLDLKTATSIGNHAFKNSPITSLILSDSLTSIGEGTFQLAKLTSLTLPKSTTSIGGWAFYSSPLTSLVIPKTTTSLGLVSFHSIVNAASTNVTIPSELIPTNRKKNDVFQQNNWNKINFNNSNSAKETAYKIIDSINFSQNGWKTTDSGVAWEAFQNAILNAKDAVNDATTTEQVEALVKSKTEGTAIAPILKAKDNYDGLNKYQGFLTREGLTKFTALSQNLWIPTYGFRHEPQLFGLDLRNTISIGGGSFEDSPITNLILSDTVTSIGPTAFGVAKLTSLKLPNSLTSIGEYAFKEARLTTLTIPNSVAILGLGAFGKSPLRELIITNNNIKVGYESSNRRTFDSIVNAASTNVTIPPSLNNEKSKKEMFREGHYDKITFHLAQ